MGVVKEPVPKSATRGPQRCLLLHSAVLVIHTVVLWGGRERGLNERGRDDWRVIIAWSRDHVAGGGAFSIMAERRRHKKRIQVKFHISVFNKAPVYTFSPLPRSAGSEHR